MAEAIKGRIRGFAEEAGESREFADGVLCVFERQGIPLAAYDAAVGNDAGAEPSLLEHLMGGGQLEIISCRRDDEHTKAAADIIRALNGDGTHVWCDRQRGSAQHRRFHTLALLRRLLVLSRQQPGPAGLLSNTAAVHALQELLPFATLLKFATAGSGLSRRGLGSSDGDSDAGSAPSFGSGSSLPLMDRLLPALRAWLLADAAAGILLPGDDNRLQLPNTPQHYIALLLMLHAHEDPRAAQLSPDDSKSSEQQQAEAQAAEQLQQQLLEAAAAWPRFKQQQAAGVAAACGSTGSTMHAADQSQQAVDAAAQFGPEELPQQQQQWQEEQSAAAGLLSFLQAQMAGGSSALSNGTADSSTAVEPQQAVPQASQVQLPTQAAAALTADITCGSSSDSSSSSAGPLTLLRCCLASMGAAALQQLQERGHRLRLHPAFLARQQALLQAKLLHMLLPLQQAAADAAQSAAQQQQQQNGSELDLPEQHSSDMAVQLEVLRRVQGFVSGLAQARVEQQQQVLPQLQQQLQRLATALEQDTCQPDSSNDAAGDHALLSNGDRASDDAASVDSSEDADEAAAAELDTAHQCLNYPSLAELLGIGNMQQLLMMERQRDLELLYGQFETMEEPDENQLTPEQLLDLKQLCDELAQEGPQLPYEEAHSLLWQLFWERQLQQSLLQQLGDFRDGSHLLLTSGHWLGLERLVQQPQQQLALWAACADAEELRQTFEACVNHSQEFALGAGCCDSFYDRLQWELARRGFEPPGGWAVAPGSSTGEQLTAANRWQQEQLQQLLQHHAGLAEPEAKEFRHICVTLQSALRNLEKRGAALACRDQCEALLVIRKLPPPAVSPLQEACTSSSTAEVIPGFWLGYAKQPLDDDATQLRHLAYYSGPASVFGLASLLVRAVLCQLPGQQPSSAQPAAAAAEPALQQLLQEQLQERLAVVHELSKLLHRIEDAGTQYYMQWTRTGDSLYQQNRYQQLRSQQQQQLLQRLLEMALKIKPTKAADLAATLIRAGKEQLQLSERLYDVLLSQMLPTQAHFDAAAALYTVHGMLNMSTVLRCVQQQQLQQDLLQLMLQHCLTWASGSSSNNVSSGSRSNSSLLQMPQGLRSFEAATATRCGLSLPVQPQDALSVLINATNHLLDAVEPCVAGWISKVLAEGMEAHKISAAEADVVDHNRETLQQLLGTQMPAKEWQQYYQQSRVQLERVKGRLPALAAQLQAASQTLSHWSWSLQQLQQTAAALSSLVRALKRALVTVVRVVQQGAAVEQQAYEGSSSAAAARDTATAAEQQRQLSLLHERLALLQAASSVLCSPGLREKSAEVSRLRDQVRNNATEAEVVARTAGVPAAPAGSNISQVQHQVGETLASIRSVCNAIKDMHYELGLPDGAVEGVGVAAAAAGLGLVAALGLWQVPPDAKGCSKNEEEALRAANGSSNGSSSSDAGKGVSWEDAFVAEAEQKAKLLELHADELGFEDAERLIAVLRQLDVPQQDAQSNGGSSSTDGSGSPRKRVLRVMQQHCSTSQAAEAAAAADLEDETALAIGDEAVLNALWALLLAVKPSVAAALHCGSIPAACRSYEAFERAVLGWPPQQEPAAAAAAEAPQQHGSDGDGGRALCSCGKPGHALGFMSIDDHKELLAKRQALSSPTAAGAAAAAAAGDVSSDDDWPQLSPGMSRAVCADPVCVTRLLQQLAQQGPPMELEMEEPLLMALMKAVQMDLLRIPEEFTPLGFGSTAASADDVERDATGLLQRQYERALQVSFCKSGSVPGLVRRLLLQEAVQQPVAWSFLAQALHDTWQQQQHLDLAQAVCCENPTTTSSSSSKSMSRQRICSAWMPELLTALLQPETDIRIDDCSGLIADLVARHRQQLAARKLRQQQQQQRGGTASDAAAVGANPADGRLSHASYAVACLCDAGCRVSLACWVLTWHSCMLQQGGDYGSVQSRASAADSASKLLGDELLSNIRLPGWYYFLPSPPPGAAAAAGQASDVQKHQPGSSSSSLWWDSSSGSTCACCTNTNEQLLRAVEAEKAFVAEAGDSHVCIALEPFECDCCRRSMQQQPSKQHDAGKQQQMYSCPACGVARYCSSSCAAKDSRNHNRHCRLLQRLSQPGGTDKEWASLA